MCFILKAKVVIMLNIIFEWNSNVLKYNLQHKNTELSKVYLYLLVTKPNNISLSISISISKYKCLVWFGLIHYSAFSTAKAM